MAGARENTVTSLLSGYLRKQGLQVHTQVGLEKADGSIVEPDFEFRNDGKFVGEAKWEDDFFQALAEARDYGLAPTVNGTIAIGYPETLRGTIDQVEALPDTIEAELGKKPFPVAFLREGAPTDLKRLSLAEIPDWIDGHIHRRLEPRTDPDEVINVLRQTARELTREIENVTAPDLFRNVLGVEPAATEEEEAAKRAAGYLLVNQITFYRVLSAVQNKYPDLDPDNLESPKDFQKYFDRVLDDNYAAIFSFSVADFYQDHHIGLLKSSVKSIYGLTPEQISHEVLGTVFHSLTPISVRKPLAAYYTKHKAAEILAGLSIQDPSATVLDPACGTGQLLSAAYRRKRALTANFSEDDHHRFVEEELTGVDIMPFAAHLTTIHLALEQPAYQTDHVRVGIADSTRLRPGEQLRPFARVVPESLQGQSELFDEPADVDDWIEGGAVARKGIEQLEIDLREVDLVIMNPPFSRQESVAHFGSDYKDRLVERMGNYGQFVHRKMSFCSYFLLLADRFLSEDGTLAAVLPASFLTKSSDRKVRQFLLDNYSIQYVCARTDRPNFSEDTDLREILLVATKGRSKSSVQYILLDGLDVEAEQILEGEESENIQVREIPFEAIGVHNLFSPLSAEAPGIFSLAAEIFEKEKLVPLEAADGEVIGGVGSGGRGIDPDSKEKDWQQGVINEKDVSGLRSHDVWIYEGQDGDHVVARHRKLNKKIQIEKSKTVPDFRRTPGRSYLDVSELDEYAVVEEPDDDWFFKFTDFDQVPRNWEGEVRNRMGHLAFLRRTDLTAPGTRHLCYFSSQKRAFHGTLWVAKGWPAKEARRQAVWMTSSFHLMQMLMNRVPGRGGYTEFHKYTALRYKVLETDALKGDDNQVLDDAFNSIHQESFPALYEQLAKNVAPSALSSELRTRLDRAFAGSGKLLGDGFLPRRVVDGAIMEVIGVPEAERDELLRRLHSLLLQELIGLKIMME